MFDKKQGEEVNRMTEAYVNAVHSNRRGRMRDTGKSKSKGRRKDRKLNRRK